MLPETVVKASKGSCNNVPGENQKALEWASVLVTSGFTCICNRILGLHAQASKQPGVGLDARKGRWHQDSGSLRSRCWDLKIVTGGRRENLCDSHEHHFVKGNRKGDLEARIRL